MDEQTLKYESLYRQAGLAGRPMKQTDIEEFQEKLNRRLPPAYQAYLRIAGIEPPKKLVGSDCHLEYLYDLYDWSVELLKEDDNPFELPEKAVVFWMHQGYQFAFFDTSDGLADPPVYYYHECEPGPELDKKTFSEWVLSYA